MSSWPSKATRGPGLRVLAAGKNRFGPEGESAWFEMGPTGLGRDRSHVPLVSHDPVPGRRHGVASGRPARACRRGPGAGGRLRWTCPTPGHRHRRAPLPAGGRRARTCDGCPTGSFGTVRCIVRRGAYRRSGMRPGDRGSPRVCRDRGPPAVRAPRSSARSRSPGWCGPRPAMGPRLAAAKAAGCSSVYAAAGEEVPAQGLRVVPVAACSADGCFEWALTG